MSAPWLTAGRASLLWGAVTVMIGLAPGYDRSSVPLLEQDRKAAPRFRDERDVLIRNRDALIQARDRARRRLTTSALNDSISATTAGLTLNVRMPDPESERLVTAKLREFWLATATRPEAMPVVITARAGRLTGGTGAESVFRGGTCRVVLLIAPYLGEGRRLTYAISSGELGRLLGTCLFAARYGAPGAGAVLLASGLYRWSGTPCFARESQVALFRCRRALLDGPRMPNTRRLVGWFWLGDPARFACGSGVTAACDTLYVRWMLGSTRRPSAVAPPSFMRAWDSSWMLPTLEFDLKPVAFERFWKDQRSPAEAYLAASGRPFSDFLRRWSVPPFAGYDPGPGLRSRETAVALLLILGSVAATLVSIRRRTASG